MTIGIGVLATSESGRDRNIVPDTVIMIADTMGSYGDVDSHGRLHKIFMYPETRLYAVAANQIDCASELMATLEIALKNIRVAERNYGAILRAIAMSCYLYKRDKFTIHEFPKMRLPPNEIDPRTASSELQQVVQKRWEEFSIGCDLVIAGFDCDGRAYLFQVNGDEHEIQNAFLPGFAAIGAGCVNALFWLSRRQQTLGQFPLRAAYHAYEAKLMAESSPHVNKHVDLLVATGEEYWFSSTHPTVPKEFKPHPEINLKTLQRLWRRHSPRDTSKVGSDAMPLSSRTSKPEP